MWHITGNHYFRIILARDFEFKYYIVVHMYTQVSMRRPPALLHLGIMALIASVLGPHEPLLQKVPFSRQNKYKSHSIDADIAEAHPCHIYAQSVAHVAQPAVEQHEHEQHMWHNEGITTHGGGGG